MLQFSVWLEALLAKRRSSLPSVDISTNSKFYVLFLLHNHFRIIRILDLNSQYANANSTDLWNLINQEARRTHTISGRMNVARIMKTWTQQPGYPLVHVHRSKNGIIHISQVTQIHQKKCCKELHNQHPSSFHRDHSKTRIRHQKIILQWPFQLRGGSPFQ